jgi:hypothetical protein
MSGSAAPAERSTVASTRSEPDQRRRVLRRFLYSLAVAWVLVGAVLYAIEVAGLLASRG